jgi:hypothetical protein
MRSIFAIVLLLSAANARLGNSVDGADPRGLAITGVQYRIALARSAL